MLTKVAFLLLVLPPQSGERPIPDVPERGLTFERDIAPIVRRHCTPCHRRGQSGPFPLRTYDQVKNWASMIRLVVSEGRMPPWSVLPAYDGHFSNERRLPAAEREQLLAWLSGDLARGRARGLPRDASHAPPREWSIGTPDAVYTVDFDILRNEALPPEGYEVPREGALDYQFLSVETDAEEDRWVQAAEVRHSHPEVVHHAMVLVDRPHLGESIRTTPGAFKSYFAGSVPGNPSVVYPRGHGKLLPARARLVLQMHYNPNGKRRFDRTEVAFLFCDEPPELEVVTEAAFNDTFRIPPGAPAHTVEAASVLPHEITLLSLLPHMHLRGTTFRYAAFEPDGKVHDLLAVDYDFNWQQSYVLRTPLHLPAGTLLACKGSFDNSRSNPSNPDPSAEVVWGAQSTDEMFIGYFNYARQRTPAGQ